MPLAELRARQLRKLNELLAATLPQNTFYAEKLSSLALPLASLDQLGAVAPTQKDELVTDFAAANHTYPLDQYVRFHRTSGTRGRPMVVMDTAADWKWWIDAWQFVLDVAEIEPADRVFMAFSFGPFIGFWSAHDAVCARGATAIPGGGMSTLARLELIESSRATSVCCTPTYALHMAETAREHGIQLDQNRVRSLIVAGEPGGSIPSTRERIEAAWGAAVVDHSGATEVGPWGYADRAGTGLYVNESEFYPEFVALDSGAPANSGELAELVITTLGRSGCPVIRYRTGDLVRPAWRPESANHFVFLPGGVLGRVDDMMIIRGVNVFPSSVEQILRGFDEIREYRLTAHKDGEMDALSVEIEDAADNAPRVADELQLRLGLKIQVTCVPPGSLPRFEAKGRRFVDQRP